MDVNIVALWLKRDPVRWLAGCFSGLTAGGVAISVAVFLAQALGDPDCWLPVKLMGTVLLGSKATEFGQSEGIRAGILVFESLALFWGVIYAHFTSVNSMKVLIPVGWVWGILSWIFSWNLFLQSFPEISVAHLPSAGALVVFLCYGLALPSVAFFDRGLRFLRGPK